jgi:hypothetical protein
MNGSLLNKFRTAGVMGANLLFDIPGVASYAPNEKYNYDRSIYKESTDIYTCPPYCSIIMTLPERHIVARKG